MWIQFPCLYLIKPVASWTSADSPAPPSAGLDPLRVLRRKASCGGYKIWVNWDWWWFDDDFRWVYHGLSWFLMLFHGVSWFMHTYEYDWKKLGIINHQWWCTSMRYEYLFGDSSQLVRVGSYSILLTQTFLFPADTNPQIIGIPAFFGIEYRRPWFDMYSTPGKTTTFTYHDFLQTRSLKNTKNHGRAALSQAHVAITFNPEAGVGCMCLSMGIPFKNGRLNGKIWIH